MREKERMEGERTLSKLKAKIQIDSNCLEKWKYLFKCKVYHVLAFK